MKTFIVKEQVLNGTVTMGVNVYGIQESSFDDAKEVLRNIVRRNGGTEHKDTISEFSYHFEGQFPVYGTMSSNPLEILA